MSRARRQPRSQRTPRRSISGDWTTTIRRSGFTAPIQASRFKTSEPCWPITQVTSGHRWIALGVTWSRTMINPEVGVGQGVQLTRSTGDEGPGARFAGCLVDGGMNLGDRWRFGGRGRVGARPRGHSGVRSPRLQNADGAAFLVDGRSSGTSAPATRTARERRRIRRPADHHCRGLARGVRARTGRRSRRCPASHARLLPQHRYHVARTGGAGDRGTRPNAVVQVIWCVHRRSRATSGVGRRYRSKFARELDRRFWRRATITSW